jgi:DNA-directed RNA polymerase subunit RPC12/RpoP
MTYCPNCKKEVVKLNETSEDYLRGMTHKCNYCKSLLLIIIERID